MPMEATPQRRPQPGPSDEPDAGPSAPVSPAVPAVPAGALARPTNRHFKKAPVRPRATRALDFPTHRVHKKSPVRSHRIVAAAKHTSSRPPTPVVGEDASTEDAPASSSTTPPLAPPPRPPTPPVTDLDAQVAADLADVFSDSEQQDQHGQKGELPAAEEVIVDDSPVRPLPFQRPAVEPRGKPDNVSYISA